MGIGGKCALKGRCHGRTEKEDASSGCIHFPSTKIGGRRPWGLRERLNVMKFLTKSYSIDCNTYHSKLPLMVRGLPPVLQSSPPLRGCITFLVRWEKVLWSSRTSHPPPLGWFQPTPWPHQTPIRERKLPIGIGDIAIRLFFGLAAK